MRPSTRAIDPPLPDLPVAHTPIWPKPVEPAPPSTVRAAALAGASAVLLIPGFDSGLGWALHGVVLAALAVVVARGAPAAPERTRLAMAGWVIIALGLLAVLALRDAGWLAPWCLLGAAVAASIAVAGGRSTGGLALGAIAVPSLAIGGLRWFGRGVARLAGRRATDTARVIGALLVTAALVGVFAPLLAGADARFGRMLRALTPRLDAGELAGWTVRFLLFGAAMAAAGYLLASGPRPDPRASTERLGRLRRVEWTLPVGVLTALFAMFVGLQLTALFGGDDYVLRTTGLTYAEYARGGFWQLLAVAVLTLPVIVAASRWARRETPADRAWLRALLGAFTALTAVILASALARMWIYQQAYGFTVFRLLAFTVELWLGLVYLMVLAAGIRLRARWLARAVLGTGLVGVVALGAINPEGFVAEHNVQRWERTGKIDADYLGELSTDAAPALTRLPEPLRSCAMARIVGEMSQPEPDDWRHWNLGRSRARAIVSADPIAHLCG